MLLLNKLNIQNITGVNVYLKKSKNKIFAGTLTFNKNISFEFNYSDKYLHMKNIIPLGPELPLTQHKFTAKKLFPSFADRIPDKKNSAYADYCFATGISVTENNPLVLLATIGRQGPSSFIFEPNYNLLFTAANLKKFRTDLGLTIRDFAALFDISASSITKIETNKLSGHDVLRNIEIFTLLPQTIFIKLMQNYAKISNIATTNLINNLLQLYYKKTCELSLTPTELNLFVIELIDLIRLSKTTLQTIHQNINLNAITSKLKKFREEAIPFNNLIQEKFADNPMIRCKLNINNDNYDALLINESGVEEKFEITCALNQDLGKKHHEVNESVAKYGIAKAVSLGYESEIAVAKIKKLIQHAIHEKIQKSYQNTSLIISLKKTSAIELYASTWSKDKITDFMQKEICPQLKKKFTHVYLISEVNFSTPESKMPTIFFEAKL